MPADTTEYTAMHLIIMSTNTQMLCTLKETKYHEAALPPYSLALALLRCLHFPFSKETSRATTLIHCLHSSGLWVGSFIHLPGRGGRGRQCRRAGCGRAPGPQPAGWQRRQSPTATNSASAPSRPARPESGVRPRQAPLLTGKGSPHLCRGQRCYQTSLSLLMSLRPISESPCALQDIGSMDALLRV